MIFNIQRFSTHDGSGIRTMIFYKGCPLRCRWCSNPESWTFVPGLLYDSRLCKGFGDCILAEGKAITRNESGELILHRELITNPEKLRETCVTRALTISGEEKTVDELLAEVEKDRVFYRENGGVTLSGGEPLSQGEELVSLLKELKYRSIKVNIETSLHVSWDNVYRFDNLTDTFLVDLKHTDEAKFREYTGGSAVLVMNNLSRLSGTGSKIIVRIPVIPGFNHTPEEMRAIIDFISSTGNIQEVHFLPYHNYGSHKYNLLGMEYAFREVKPVEDHELKGYTEYAENKNLKTKIGG